MAGSVEWQYDRAEYAAGVRTGLLAGGRIVRFALGPALLVALAASRIAQGRADEAVPVLVGTVVVLAFVAVLLVVLPRRDFTRRGFAGETVRFSWDDDGFTLARGGAEQRMPWERVTGARVGKRFVVLSAGRAWSVPIPRRALDQQAQADVLRSATPARA